MLIIKMFLRQYLLSSAFACLLFSTFGGSMAVAGDAPLGDDLEARDQPLALGIAAPLPLADGDVGAGLDDAALEEAPVDDLPNSCPRLMRQPRMLRENGQWVILPQVRLCLDNLPPEPLSEPQDTVSPVSPLISASIFSVDEAPEADPANAPIPPELPTPPELPEQRDAV